VEGPKFGEVSLKIEEKGNREGRRKIGHPRSHGGFREDFSRSRTQLREEARESVALGGGGRFQKSMAGRGSPARRQQAAVREKGAEI